MCLAVPGKIIKVTGSGDDPLNGRVATVDMQGSRVEAVLSMTPDADVGDWVLVHAGFALTVVDEAEAKETWEALQIALGDDVPPAVSSGSA
jgi:hydrogenase expression/formation protein HypC